MAPEVHEASALERIAALEANRENDVRRIGRLEAAVDTIKMQGWIIVGAVLVEVLLTAFHPSK